MGRLRSGRVKRTPLTGVTSDRYKFLGLEQAEPTFGDPLVGPSSVSANPIPVGQVYQVVSVSNSEGRRYWTPLVGFGTTVGVISVYENGFLPAGDNRFQKIHGLNFVGTGVTIESPPVDGPFEGVGIATIRISVNEIKNQGDVGEILYNSSSGLANGANAFIYDESSGFVGIGSTLPTTNLDVSGNIKASQFIGNVNGNTVTTSNVIGGIGSFSQLIVTGSSTLSNVISTGIITATKFSGDLDGIAQKAINLNGGLSGELPYQSGPGVTTFLSTSGATNKFLKYNGTSPVWSDIEGLNGNFTNIDVNNSVLNKTQYLTFSASIGSTSSLNLNSAKLVFNSDSSSLGIGTTSPTSELDVIGDIKASKNISANSLNVSGISTLGIVQISSGIITATSGIITYYGDGSKLINIPTGIATNATNAVNVIGGIASVTSLTVSGISTFNNTIIINGAVSAGGTLGGAGQYLVSTGTGVTWTTLPSSTRTVDSQIASPGQTVFTTEYVVGLLDVFFNGVRLSSNEYVANDSSQVTITFPSFGGEVVEFVSYSSYSPGPYNIGGTSQWISSPSGIHTTSNVGIGTTNPTSKLTVVGNAVIEGDITVNDINSTSDLKLKENIQKIENPISTVMRIDGVSFDWKSTKKSSFGVIAQDLETILPNLVSGDEIKSVNYNGLIGLLIEVVKEQQQQIEELRSKI